MPCLPLQKLLAVSAGRLSVKPLENGVHLRQLRIPGGTRDFPQRKPGVQHQRFRAPEPRPLDLDAMRRAAAQLCGRHEFSAFSTGKKTGRAATRTIESIGIERSGEEVRLTYTGDGFLYNMVRILTGTLLEVGLGERRPDDMEAILASHSRASAGFTAPAQGLFLWDVTY